MSMGNRGEKMSEYDALKARARQRYGWRRGAIKFFKRRFWKRQRYLAKRQRL